MVTLLLLLLTVNIFGMYQDSLTVITGPMSCGKTEKLIHIIKTLQLSSNTVLVCKHSLDTRSASFLKSRSIPDANIKAFPISSPVELKYYINMYPSDYIIFDEIQFAGKDMADLINAYRREGKRFIVSGLDTDFKRQPFAGCMTTLLAYADKVIKLKAVCSVCKRWNATLTQRIVNGRPAHINDPLIIVDDGHAYNVVYEPRCIACHQLLL